MTATAPSWDFPRSAFGVVILCQLAEEHGQPATKALAATGLELAQLTRPDVEIAAGQELTVVRNVLRLLGDVPGLGAQAGSRVTLGMAGLWGFAMLNAHTTRQAIEVALRYGYGHFSFVFARPEVELGAQELRVMLQTAELPADVRAFLVERDLAAHLTLIPRLLGPTSVRVETTLSHDRTRAISAVTQVREIVAKCGRDCFALRVGILDRRLPMADEYAFARWQQQCDALLARQSALPSGTGIAGVVRAAVQRDIAHPPTLEELAATLNVSARTLRRQLTDAGVSFRSILDDARRTAAEELLQHGHSVAAVCARLGYANPPAFIRAYRRWTGHTPGAERTASVS